MSRQAQPNYGKSAIDHAGKCDCSPGSLVCGICVHKRCTCDRAPGGGPAHAFPTCPTSNLPSGQRCGSGNRMQEAGHSTSPWRVDGSASAESGSMLQVELNLAGCCIEPCMALRLRPWNRCLPG